MRLSFHDFVCGNAFVGAYLQEVLAYCIAAKVYLDKVAVSVGLVQYLTQHVGHADVSDAIGLDVLLSAIGGEAQTAKLKELNNISQY